MSDRAKRTLAYQIFAEALDVQESGRAHFVDERCGEDAELSRLVRSLIQVAAKDSLPTGALRGVPIPNDEALLGKIVGRFRLVERVGEGGMGVVFRAERIDGVQQSVAIKLVGNTLAAAVQPRFEREAQLLARLEHPSIARLIDAGIEDARAWIAVEYVRGQRIDEYCAARDLPPRDIVRLLVLLADAVAAAHRMLVVHSDIKPANVLVTADGMPKLVDFGISTALREAGAAVDGHSPTVSIGRLFSPNYAAPEQIGGGPLTVATDVFGLGALAYRLLAGVPPYADARTPIAYLLAITQHDAAPASSAALTAGRGAAVAHALRGDLDAIVSRAIERDPARRYASAEDMQADLKRYLEGRPVHARPPSVTYRAGKFLRRNAVVTSLSGLLIACLIGAGVVTAVQARRTALAHAMAARRGEFLESLLKSADPRGGRRDISVAELLDSATSALDVKLADEPLVEASMLGLITDTYDGLGHYGQALAASDRQLELLREHGGSPLELARALTSRGEVLREQGRWDETVSAMRWAVGLLRPLHSPGDLAPALSLLAIALGQTHHEEEAEKLYLEEIALESAGDGELRKRLAYPYAALNTLMAEQGRYRESLEYGRKSVELGKQSMPADHQDLLAFELNYARALQNTHRSAEAEPIVRDIVAREARVSGPSHKDTMLAQWVLADDLVDLHRDAEAAELARSTAQTLDTLLGPDNSYALSAWQTYAIAACNSHHEEPGLAAAVRVAAARRRLLPPDNRFVHGAAAAVGLCLFRSGRYAEAEQVLLAAIAGLEAARGPSYVRTQAAYSTLRDLYVAVGRPQDAAVFTAKLESR
jgi:serine/threonine-protein kinase